MEDSPEVRPKTAPQIFASEFVKILKLIGISILITMCFGLTYSIVMAPEMISDDNQQKFNKEYAEREKGNPIHLAFGDLVWSYLGESKYDKHIHSRYQLFDINKARHDLFINDFNDKISICLIICSILLIVGRYIILFARWVDKNSKT